MRRGERPPLPRSEPVRSHQAFRVRQYERPTCHARSRQRAHHRPLHNGAMSASSQHAARPVLVTGAMGLLGRRVVEVLLGRGSAVVALDVRNAATESTAVSLSRQANGNGDLLSAWVDLLDPEAVRQLVEQCMPAAIIHLAAIVSPACYRNPSAARKVNVE